VYILYTTKVNIFFKLPTLLLKIVLKEYQKEQYQIVQGLHEPLIDIELYDKVQEVISGKKKINKRIPDNKLLYLRGHLVCRKCGRNLTGSSSSNRLKVLYHYYHCSCGCIERFRAIDANNEIINYITEIIKPEHINESYYVRIINDFNRDNSKRLNKINENELAIHTRKNRLKTIEDNYLDGELNIKDYKNAKNRIGEEITEFEIQNNNLKTVGIDFRRYIRKSIQILKMIPDVFKSGTITIGEKRKILCSIFPHNLIFDNAKYRTQKLNGLLDIIDCYRINYGDKKTRGN